MARAPGGQMQGAATQAMWWHRRGAATPQMPAGLGASSKMYTLFPDGPLPGLACRTTLESLVLRPKPAYVDGEGSLTRSTCRAQSSENGRGLPHSRDGHATRLAWHERLARQRPGGVEDSLGITSRPYEEGASQVSGRKCDYRTDQDIPGPGYMKVEALIEVPDAQHRG